MPISQKTNTRDRILGAAEGVFANKGYHDALVDEIADQVALSKGGIYFHFPSKEDLFFSVLDRLADRLVAKAEQAASRESSPLARAEGALSEVLMTLGSRRRLAKVLMVQGYSMGNAFEAKRIEIFGRFANVIQSNLDEAVRAKEIPPIDTAVAAYAWLGAINEVVIRWLYEGTPKPAEAAPTLRRVLVSGLSVRSHG
jgi:TetR/AcrR family transcriptional regulator, fatty acid metabolism regulator protein